MIVYTENPKESTKNLEELIHKLNKTGGYNLKKSMPIPLQIKVQTYNFKIFLFTIASTRIKHLGKKFNKKRTKRL
jgi:hypothetical protein